jgi:hypothetical protein
MIATKISGSKSIGSRELSSAYPPARIKKPGTDREVPALIEKHRRHAQCGDLITAHIYAKQHVD